MTDREKTVVQRHVGQIVLALVLLGGMAGERMALGESVVVGDIIAQRERVNSGTVGIIGGDRTSTDLHLAADLADAFDDGYDIRVMATLGKGSVRNVEDLLLLRGIDVAIVQSNVLAFYKANRVIPNIDDRIRYIAKLFNEEMHVLAKSSYRTIDDLQGARVNFGSVDSGTFMTANMIFDQLEIEVDVASYPSSIALQKLRDGEIDAMVRVAGKPLNLFLEIGPDEPIHLLAVPLDRIEGDFLAGELTAETYPGLIEPDAPVETVAVGEVMAAYNWPEGHAREKKVRQFVNRFFGDFDQLLEPPFHPKWQDTDLTEELPGWQRLPSADQALLTRE